MQESLKRYKELKDLMNKYNYANFIMNFDSVTDCPKRDREYSDEVQEFFYKKSLDISLSDEYTSLVYKLFDNIDSLDEVTALDIKLEHKGLEKIKKIPKDELDKHINNSYKCAFEWEKARKTLDYSKFLKELEELVSYNKKYTIWQQTDKLVGYDVILDDMEEGYNRKMYDEFFKVIEDELVPFVKEVLSKKQRYNPKLDTLRFDISKQKEITKLIAEKMEYNDEVGCIRETIHPFTNWANNNDVRITTSYSEDLLFSNIYSVMHEIGHALFQLQMDPKYNNTNVFENVSCITHESQSRFYENYLGRSKAFVKFLFPILKKYYPSELEDITFDDMYNYINAAKAQFKRTEADELTYPLHVLIRYNVEKELFDNKITVNQMEERFNYYMEKYLGIKPSNMLEGVFQDSHWSSGFGYFPTYAVGSAYGAMFLNKMKEDIDVDKELEKGDFSKINKWLKDNIHQYSGTRNNLKVIKEVTGKDFDPHEYVKYLKEKFSKIYF